MISSQETIVAHQAPKLVFFCLGALIGRVQGQQPGKAGAMTPKFGYVKL